MYLYYLLVIFSCFARAKSARNSREIRAKFVKSQREIPEGMPYEKKYFLPVIKETNFPEKLVSPHFLPMTEYVHTRQKPNSAAKKSRFC